MRKPAKHLLTAAGALALVLSGASLLPRAAMAADAPAAEKSPAEQGKEIAYDRVKGNCLACHVIAKGELPGNVGPALVNMKARFPDKAQLRAQIWDATVKSPNTIMPPYGRLKIISEEELDKVVEFIYGL